MTLLVAGLVLWWATHLLKPMAPARRAELARRFGEGPVKGGVALLSLAAVVAMVIGYQGAPHVALWTPPGWAVHLNNLLMLLAVLLFGAGHAKSVVRTRIRHPQLAAVKVWAFAHLLVAGHLAAVILFGGMIGWAVVAMIALNRRDGAWVRPPAGTRLGLIRHLAVTLIVFVAIVLIHWQVAGVRPFPGSA